MMKNKERILSMDHNEKIYCEYCDSECTASSLKYGNTLMDDSYRDLWYRWDFICLDCAEKLIKEIENDPELEESMRTRALVAYSFKLKSGSQ